MGRVQFDAGPLGGFDRLIEEAEYDLWLLSGDADLLARLTTHRSSRRRWVLPEPVAPDREQLSDRG
jgi:hypothetical protein